MREFIKRFDTPASADGYNIDNIPCILLVSSTEQKLHTKRSNMMLETEEDNVNIVEAPP